jgi:hypothetical protein
MSKFDKSKLQLRMILALLVLTGVTLIASGSAPKEKWQMGEPIITYWAGPAPITDFAAKQMSEGGFNLAWVSARGKPKQMPLLDYYCINTKYAACCLWALCIKTQKRKYMSTI